jgi:hypothetical protein
MVQLLARSLMPARPIALCTGVHYSVVVCEAEGAVEGSESCPCIRTALQLHSHTRGRFHSVIFLEHHHLPQGTSHIPVF